MNVTIRLPPALSDRIGSRGSFAVKAETVHACLQQAAEDYPQLNEFLWQADGRLNPVLHIFLQDEILHDGDLKRTVKPGDCIDIIPAIEGG